LNQATNTLLSMELALYNFFEFILSEAIPLEIGLFRQTEADNSNVVEGLSEICPLLRTPYKGYGEEASS
jgi:hypothetical protein